MFVQEKHMMWFDHCGNSCNGIGIRLVGICVCVWEAEIAPFQLDVRGEIEWCETNSCPLKIGKQAFPKGNESSPNPPIFRGWWGLGTGECCNMETSRSDLAKLNLFLNRMVSISKRIVAHGFFNSLWENDVNVQRSYNSMLNVYMYISTALNWIQLYIYISTPSDIDIYSLPYLP